MSRKSVVDVDECDVFVRVEQSDVLRT